MKYLGFSLDGFVLQSEGNALGEWTCFSFHNYDVSNAVFEYLLVGPQKTRFLVFTRPTCGASGLATRWGEATAQEWGGSFPCERNRILGYWFGCECLGFERQDRSAPVSLPLRSFWISLS